jgi:hypothetical protein
MVYPANVSPLVNGMRFSYVKPLPGVLYDGGLKTITDLL